ncbi:MAG: type 4a pilus biogenesis protein PilO [Psychromonas sp.]
MNLSAVDFDNISRWPALYRGGFIALVSLIFSAVFYYYITIPQLKQLKVAEVKEQKLKNEFNAKASLSSNLETYQMQLSEIKVIFDGLINKLANKKEVASLLDDISFIGADNGLQFKSINWGVKKEDGDLSVEVPIRIKVIGSYQQLGHFVADIATLPRIVILDELRLSKGAKGQITLNVVAKTYRYKGKVK